MFDFMKRGYPSMNDRQRQEIVMWCKTWDEERCQRCGTGFDVLEKDALIKEETSGKKRIMPVYLLGHIDGDPTHQDGRIFIDREGKPISYGKSTEGATLIMHKWGNLRRICYPCNKIEEMIHRKSPVSAPTTREKADRINNETPFIFEVESQLHERGHVCYKAIIKAGKNICDTGETACSRYLDTEIKTQENPKGKFHDFAYVCGGAFCNGTHISFAGVKPDVIIQEERLQLEREWDREYDLSSWMQKKYEGHEPMTLEEAIYQWSNFGQRGQWISKEQYVNERLKFNW